jgi:glycosyltransferase involved in cell wall biosynthesis
MAMGIPVVCSNIGFAGLGIASGDGAIMQTDPQAFAQSVIELLQSATLRERIGTKGKEVILKHFDWDVVSLQLEQYLLQVALKKKGGGA